MKSTWSLILAAGVVVTVLFIISLTSRKAPTIPADAAHRAVPTQEGCVTCHAPGKQAPLKVTHPPKEQCFICHKINQP